MARRLPGARHRRIAFVGGSPENAQQAVRERIEGYREALREAGLWTASAESFGGVYVAVGEALTAAVLERCPDVTAILTVNDLVASGALRALRRRQRRVPEEVAVI